MGKVLEQQKPEAAIIMVGTNDISGGRIPESYRAGLEEVVRRCVAAHCVPILNTIPPRRGHDEAVDHANKIIREVAREQQIPLADFHSECLRVRPGNSWDGTIMSEDGVHPSGGGLRCVEEVAHDCWFETGASGMNRRISVRAK